MKKIEDGQYIAICKERNALAAAMNGHAAVFPEARCTIANGQAVFKRDGTMVWSCNAAYAEANFNLKPIA
ncbi:hypothetical protein AWB65_06536 [Caballeronia humi]|uniref:Uncharacterized protein n=2 Tax=Caballeronia humi TaxID=326474 RepID=A0A158JGR8_9BURK|nr:hypothetical protein AWB65_06536 [Caballeronia humi]